MKVYFAHPYATIGTEDGARIIAELKKRGDEIYNPFESHVDEDWYKRIREDQFSFEDTIKLVELDLRAINQCDYVLIWLPAGVITYGTVCEMVYAFKFCQHPVVIYPHSHPWIEYHSDELYLSIENWIKGNQWRILKAYKEKHESKS